MRLLILLALAATAAPAGAQVFPSFGEDRVGTAEFAFLKVPVDPRGTALGEAAVVLADDVGALYWNPALAARAGRTAAAAHHLQYVADVDMTWAGGLTALGPFTLGAHVQALDGGEMAETTEFSGPAGTGQTFRFLALSAGVTVAQQLTELFAYGVTAKYAREEAAEVAYQTGLLDLGAHYRVGDTGAEIAVSIRNFGLNGQPEGQITRPTLEGDETVEDFEGFVPPTTFGLGVAYRPFPRLQSQDVVLTTQLTNPNDNAERINVGAEYAWNGTVFLRAGYRIGQSEAALPTFGFGLAAPGTGLRVDYGFSSFERLGASHRFGVNFSID